MNNEPNTNNNDVINNQADGDISNDNKPKSSKKSNRVRNVLYLIGGGLIGLGCLLSLSKQYGGLIAQNTYKKLEKEVVETQPHYDTQEDDGETNAAGSDGESSDASGEPAANGSAYKGVVGVDNLSGTKKINFERLKELNHETVGWISIEQLGIEYPIVQTTNNDYYLNHMFDGTENESGAIMLNFDNASDFTDQNNIVYGHTLKDSSMFGPLKRLLKETDNIQNFVIYTPQETIEYEIIVVSEVEKTNHIYQTIFAEEGFSQCMESLQTTAKYFVDIGDTSPDRFITLSTCKGDRRIVVVARPVT